MDSNFCESKDGCYLYSVNGNECSLRRVNKYIPELIIPEKIDGKIVSAVSSTVFENGKEILEKVVFPDSVNHLEYKSFVKMAVLRSVVLSGGITIIPMDSFVDCDVLEKIVIPRGVSSVQSLATHECKSLKKIVIYEDNLIFSGDSFANIVNRLSSFAYDYPRYKLDGTPDHRYNLVKTVKGTVIHGAPQEDLTLFVHQGSYTERRAKQYGYKTEILEKNNFPSN